MEFCGIEPHLQEGESAGRAEVRDEEREFELEEAIEEQAEGGAQAAEPQRADEEDPDLRAEAEQSDKIQKGWSQAPEQAEVEQEPEVSLWD